jgi:UDP-N-acetylmuramyl pentapeptide synthase
MSALQPNAGTAHLERMAAMERVCEADDEVLRLAGSEGAVAAAKRLSEARADYRAMEERESNGQ